MVGSTFTVLLGKWADRSLGDYDLGGFAVGAVERSLILPRPDITPGDILLGLASSGLHSNGFSLVRKVIALSGLTYETPCPWRPETSLGRELLMPTKIYIKQLLPLIQTGLIKGMSHITGGGFTENIPRVLPKGTGCFVDAAAWELPPVFRFLMRHGGIEPREMARTFNNGIGMVLIVDRAVVNEVKSKLAAVGEQAFQIGEVTAEIGVEMRSLDRWHS
jgi:phosphoribosylamine--glycine ligase / phosphoribosylformylglycinamidine cyclo-ligase